MRLAPIILFVYNRPWHTQQTIQALLRCEFASESDLYIFADGPKDNATEDVICQITEVRQYIKTIKGFNNIFITESPINKGLANSVIQGVSEVINKQGRVIVLEDDIIVHRYFLRFMNEALEKYKNSNHIYMIGAYSYNVKIPIYYIKNVYLTPRYCSWGWATWQNRWEKADWNINNYSLINNTEHNIKDIDLFNRGSNNLFRLLKQQQNKEIDSWAIRWQYCLYSQNGYTLQPVFSLSYNIGFDGTGVHCPSSFNHSTIHSQRNPPRTYRIRFPSNIKPNNRIIKNYKKTQDGDHIPTIKERLKYFINKRLKKWNILK